LNVEPGFARLSLSRQFALLQETIGTDHPAEAANPRDSNASTQRAILGWLADVTSERPAVREVELWRVRKGTRELRCVAVYLTSGIDVRLLEENDFRRTQLMADAPAAHPKAAAWKQSLRATGWN
jgi:hypothetical protein